MKYKGNLGAFIEKFFIEKMQRQLGASIHTIAAYRDTFKLLFRYTKIRLKKLPSDLMITDLNADLICDFLNDLESNRGVKIRTRNVRLAALRSFFKYLAFQAPELEGLIGQVLAIPNKKFTKKLVNYLTDEEVNALLKAIDQKTWVGRRDFVLIALAIGTGLRASELINLRRKNISLDPIGNIQCIGKGRKERNIPLTNSAVRMLRRWFRGLETSHLDLVFPKFNGEMMGRYNLKYLLDKYAAIARMSCHPLKNKHVSPHVLRHTAAMLMRQHGLDITTIAIFLGHESIETTQVYLGVDLSMREEVLNQHNFTNTELKRFKPGDDQLENFLNNL